MEAARAADRATKEAKKEAERVKKAADVVRKAAAKENNAWRACAKATRRTGTGWAGCPCGAYRVCPACRREDVARANRGEPLVLCPTKSTGAQPKPIGASSPASPFTAGFVFSGPRLCPPRFGPCSPKSKPSGANFATQPIANAIIRGNPRSSGGSLKLGPPLKAGMRHILP